MRQNEEYFWRIRQWVGRYRDHFIRILAWTLMASIALPLCIMNVTASTEKDLCQHHPEHTEECGYNEDGGETSCNFICPICTAEETVTAGVEGEETAAGDAGDDTGNGVVEIPDLGLDEMEDSDLGMDEYQEADEGFSDGQEADTQVNTYPERTEAAEISNIDNPGAADNEQQPVIAAADQEQEIVSWSWDSEYLEWDEAAQSWKLKIYGASASNPYTRDKLMSFLPGEITAKKNDVSEEILDLTWQLDSIPVAGVYNGSYILTADLPSGYILGAGASQLQVRVVFVIDKYVSAWSYVSRGGTAIEADSSYRYSMEYYLNITSDYDAMVQKIENVLPDQLLCSGYYNWDLYSAGFTLVAGQDTAYDGKLKKGYVEIDWQNFNEVIEAAGTIADGMSLCFEAVPVSKEGYRLRVNSNDPALNDGTHEDVNDTAEIDGILNLTIHIHDLHLKDHTVTGINPPSTTVNLFDYWVDTSGAEGNDLLRPYTDKHINDSRVEVERTGVENWNKGINLGRLLLFGDGNIHAGYWNKGAGASSDYGKRHAGMSGIVSRILEEGYPVIDTTAMKASTDGYEGISDYELCGDHDGAAGTAKTSLDPQNISNTVIEKWEASGNSASLDYLFDPSISNSYKESYQDVKGLFQIDANGYYYYDMRQNFAEFDEKSNRFVLYDAAAVDRTDESYKNGEFEGGRSIGNFLPFNSGEQVFDIVKDGKLSSNENISSHNDRTTAGYVNHHLGMTVDIEFRQPLSGMINMGTLGNQPMTFQFSGDDDVWIFIDDVLVLDLGGIHSEIYGTIDFASGNISVGQSWKTNGFPYKDDGTVDIDKLHANAIQTTNLKAQFTAAGKEDTTLWNGNTFASNTSHELKMFYLERGNYDSSLALRFNLQPLLYQQIKKVDQNGNPLAGVEFDLCPAEETTEDAEGAICCLYTDNMLHGGNEFYVRRAEGEAFVHLTTDEDGNARFVDEKGEYFNFADRGNQYYILKETKTPDGYRTLPVDIVLYYDPATSMLSVANRWATGAYACSVIHMAGTSGLTYGHFNAQTGNIEQNQDLLVASERQRDGLVVAIPMLRRQSDHVWEALYGSNLGGFTASKIKESTNVTEWRTAALRAVLEQAADTSIASWNLTWDSETLRLTGALNDLPGLASRYRLNNPDGDMQMVYGIIEAKALEQLGIHENDADARYEALGRYVREHGTEETLRAIMRVAVDQTGSGQGFSFLNADQFNRNFRSLIYIPNEQRELWVMKVDQNGKLRNGTEFGLYDNADCSGAPVARGVTANVNGQDGTLIFSPRNDSSPGYAQVMWASSDQKHYYLKELAAPSGCSRNDTVIPVVVGTYSIYADAGTQEDGVSVMAGVGRLTQTMRQYAMDDDVDITLQDITAIQQYQPSTNTDVRMGDWQDVTLSGTDVRRTLNLHFGKNAVVDYGLHDKDGGKYYKPFFVADTGFVRARVKQNYEALTTPVYENAKMDANKDNLKNTDITNLFSLLNVVVVTDETVQDTNTGSLVVSKMLMGPDLSEEDYTRNFNFTIRLTDANGKALTGEYYFYGTDKAGYISNGSVFPLHHDESITILGLPAGTRYAVTETTAENWYVFPKTGTASGTVDKDKSVFASFYNSKEPWPEIGLLTLHKTVVGSGDKTREFTFTLDLTDENGVTLEEDFHYTGDKEGSIRSGESVTLHHDQHITILDLPAGTRYQVSEQEADQDGYTTSLFGESGIIADGEIYTAAITNAILRKNQEGPGPVGDPGKNPDDTDPSEKPKDPSGRDPFDEPNGTDSTKNPEGEKRGLISPVTGDLAPLLSLLGVMSVSGLGTAFAVRRSRKKKQ